MTLLLLRNNLIPFYQSSNFIQSLSNHSGSSAMFFGNPAWMFLLFVIATGASTTDISSVVVYSYLSEASSVICKNPSHFDNASISFFLLELIVVLPRSFSYMCFVPDR